MPRPRTYERIFAALIPVLLLFGIGSYGLLAPFETSIALDPESGAAAGPESPLTRWLVAASTATFGLHEWSARLPVLLGGLLTCALSYFFLRREPGPRAGVLAAIVTASTPLFLFNARLSMGAALGMAAQASVALAAWSLLSPEPATGSRVLGYVSLLASVVASVLASGLLLGPLPALLAAVVCVLIASRSERTAPRPQVLLLGVVCVVGLVGVVQAVLADSPQYSAWLGGAALGVAPPTYDALLSMLFHSFAPFSPAALLALIWVLAPRSGRSPAVQNLSWFFLLWLGFAYVSWTLFSSRYGPAPFLAILPLAGCVAIWMDELTADEEAHWPAAVLVLLFMGLLVRDYLLYPESVVAGLAVQGLSFPKGLVPWGPWALLFGLCGIAFVMMLTRPRARHRGLAVLLCAGAVAVYVCDWVQPALSEHLSPRTPYLRYLRLATSEELLASYRVSARLRDAYERTPTGDFDLAADAVQYLDAKERRWLLLGPEAFSSLDRDFRKQTGRHLFVADARSGQLWLAASEAVRGQQDRNPLTAHVLAVAPEPQNPVHAVFGHRTELLGYDLHLPGEDFVRAGQGFGITWYWRVLEPMPENYEVFVHIDGLGRRLHGDHAPVAGHYPTELWEPGDIIVDAQRLRVPAHLRPGNYSIYVGLFSGDERLKLVQGPDDGGSRARVGTLPVR